MKSSTRPWFDETNMTLRSLPGRLLAAVVASFLVLLGGAGTALAHDSVTGTSPANGTTVAGMPQTIEITMSNTPASIGSQVLVLDEAGTNWAQGEVEVLDTVASQAVRAGAPGGSYTVKWRLVSSDSHPIEGEFSFTATAGGTTTGGATPAVAAPTAPAAGAGPVASVSAVPEAAAEPVANNSAVPWSIIGLVVVLVGLVVAMVLTARRRLARED